MDLFSAKSEVRLADKDYTAKDIEVLEGLEPVRKRPGMYIGGSDETAMHHLVSEIFDNSMDEAVAGFATRIELHLDVDGTVTVKDNGRGIPIDQHPRYPEKSALEVIMTTLHSGGKFSGKVYETSGGLHGVGMSVVNALSDRMSVEVVRDKEIWRQEYSRGHVVKGLTNIGAIANRRGTTISFHADPEIFGEKSKMRPKILYTQAKSKAFLYKGVEIRWSCAPELVADMSNVPEKEVIHFPNGLADYLTFELEKSPTVTSSPFVGEMALGDERGKVEWAIHWALRRDGFLKSYCNTVNTPLGGTHELGFRNALIKGLKNFGEMTGNKKAVQITADDIFTQACSLLSLFYKDPAFQGQTKDKLTSVSANKLVENAIRDHFDNWLSANTSDANILLEFVIQRAEERIKRKAQKEVSRKSIVHKLRLPGKLADCTQEDSEGTELFLVEGDSAGGSAKQARNRNTQAILPLRGKILNVASATREKIRANQEIKDMLLALGCGSGFDYDEDKLRYEKVIIMTDADVDGAHISSLLMTYFYKEMPKLIDNGHLYLAQPPLFRIKQGNNNYYAQDEKHREEIISSLPKNKGNIELGRFKGLGEMTPSQLKETTMDPEKRCILKVGIEDDARDIAAERVDHLMGKKPEYRFQFIQEQATLKGEGIFETLDV